MKRTGYIYEKLCDKALIREAIIKASRKKRRRKSVRRILNDIDHYVDEIYTMMLNEEFTPSPYRRFRIKDGATQKEREICCPKFYPDQIIHWMLIMAIQPILQRGMYEFNCGSVPGRGAHYGKRYLERWYKRDRKNTKYCAKLDVRKFYPSAKSPVIMRELRRVIKCKRTLRLCEVILNSADGLPIGNYTSQWFANFLLQRLDHYIKEVLRIPHYVRYMDDMCLFSASKRALHKAVKAIREFLAGLSLQLKSNWQVFPTASRAAGLSRIPILPGENHAAEKPLATDEAQGKENPLLYRETRRESPATRRGSRYELRRMAQRNSYQRLLCEIHKAVHQFQEIKGGYQA